MINFTIITQRYKQQTVIDERIVVKERSLTVKN